MARIATVYTDNHHAWALQDMSYIRWQKISEALARESHTVDIVSNEPGLGRGSEPIVMAEHLRRVPLQGIDWSQYDVIKTLFHIGFEVLEKHGGSRHPFVISKLGSVVAGEDRPGIYFYGNVRRKLFETQARIHRTSRYVTVLSEPARDLFLQAHGDRPGMLLVPGAVDHTIPSDTENPYTGGAEKVCIFSGNIYQADSQPEANRVLVDKLNSLGEHLQGSGIRVYFQGPGDTSRLDDRFVTCLGSCAYDETWQYLEHASIGIVVSAGNFMHNNESTKLYHYLRAGLPVVSEAGFPNDYLVPQAGLGYVVPSGDMEQMAAAIRKTAATDWSAQGAIDFILANHTWDCRARVYGEVVPKKPGGSLSRAWRWLHLHPLQSIPERIRRRRSQAAV